MATSSEKNKIMKLSQAEFTTLSTTGTLTKDGVTYTYSPSDTIYVTPDAISGLSEYKEQLRLICNRYLDSTDRLPIDCTWEELIAVFNEYDEYSYMNAFLNSIEVFPDKDYSINDTEGHIKGFRDYAFRENKAIKSLCLAGITSINLNSAFYNCTALEKVCLPNCTNIASTSCFSNSGLVNLSTPKLTGGTFTNAFQPSLKFATWIMGNLQGYSAVAVNITNSNTPNFEALIMVDTENVAVLPSNLRDALINLTTFTPYVPSALLSSYQSATNWTNLNSTHPITDIESHLAYLRGLGADFSYTPYANKKWENNQLVDDATIGEVTL